MIRLKLKSRFQWFRVKCTHFNLKCKIREMHKTVGFHSKWSVSWELLTEGYQGRPLRTFQADRKTLTRYANSLVFWSLKRKTCTWWSRKISYFWFTQWEYPDKAKEKHMKSAWKAYTFHALLMPFSYTFFVQVFERPLARNCNPMFNRIWLFGNWINWLFRLDMKTWYFWMSHDKRLN